MTIHQNEAFKHDNNPLIDLVTTIHVLDHQLTVKRFERPILRHWIFEISQNYSRTKRKLILAFWKATNKHPIKPDFIYILLR
jgi:hypothetical protein